MYGVKRLLRLHFAIIFPYQQVLSGTWYGTYQSILDEFLAFNSHENIWDTIWLSKELVCWNIYNCLLETTLKSLPTQRDKALEAGDHADLKKIRRKIHKLKNKLRRAMVWKSYFKIYLIWYWTCITFCMV